jgi:hypothetical protein
MPSDHFSFGAAVRGCTDVLLGSNATPPEKHGAADALFRLLADSTALQVEDLESADQAATMLPSGRAISPVDAGRCLLDDCRTAVFMRGVVAAIEAAGRRFTERPLRVLYAGCGPFAPLVLPLAHRWAPGEVRYTLVDIHPRALAAAKHLAAALTVDDRIAEFVAADATRYHCQPDQPPHLLISETMQCALEAEPQVAIVRNLAPQLAIGGYMLPERIELHATLMDPAREFDVELRCTERRRQELGCVMIVDKDGDRCGSLLWPHDVPSGLHPMLRTRVAVFGDLVLEDYASGLTIPRPLVFDTPPQPGARLRCEYRLTPRPGLVWTSVSPA